jgi:polar amino acid transport system substrate-binding protein
LEVFQDMKRLAAALLFILITAPSEAQTPPGVLRVATREVKPFVFDEGGHLTGFSIELWQEISRQMNVKSEFILKPSVQDLLDSVKSHETTLGIAAISITAEREMDLDLSQPMFDAGLQILTPIQGTQRQRLLAVIAGALSSTALPFSGSSC